MVSSGSLDAELYEAAPANLALEQVHVYVRHGERSPVTTRLEGFVPERWNLCHLASTFFHAATQSQQPSRFQATLEGFDSSRKPGDCMLGQLTDLGRRSTLNFGATLRQLYIDRLAFIPNIAETNDQTYFRSTNMARTMESLQQIIEGLYPVNKRRNDFTPQIYVRQGSDEDLLASTSNCDRLRQLEKQFAAAVAKEVNPRLASLDQEWAKYNEGHPIRLDGHPKASSLFGTMMVANAHGVRLPAPLEDPESYKLLEIAICAEWFSGYKDPEFRKLAAGRLLDALQHRMSSKAKLGEADPLKIAVISCHDTTLAGICASLDVFDNRWPAFTASVTFELFSKQVPTSRFAPVIRRQPAEYYVRLRYQNKSLAPPFCAAPKRHLEGHPEFCTLKAFKSRIAELTPKDWRKECNPTPE